MSYAIPVWPSSIDSIRDLLEANHQLSMEAITNETPKPTYHVHARIPSYTHSATVWIGKTVSAIVTHRKKALNATNNDPVFYVLFVKKTVPDPTTNYVKMDQWTFQVKVIQINN